MNIKTITPNPPANFSPNVEIPNTEQPFRFWCQKVLPLVYDDSLSYYELLCKVVDYLNTTMKNVNTLGQDVDNINNAYNQLQDYVNNYFSTLDVQEEINNKLDEMANDGTLLRLFVKYYPIVTPNMYGCKGDGVTDDTINFQKCINDIKGKNITLMLSGTYKLSNITIDDYITIVGNTAKIICNSFEIYKPIQSIEHTIIDNVVFDSVNGIVITGGKNIIIQNCTILTDETGIEINKNKNQNYENVITNCCIYAKTLGKIGILVNTSDSSFININMRDFTIACEVNYQCVIDNLHSWISEESKLTGSIFCVGKGGSPTYGETSMVNCCIDTYETGFKLSKNPYFHITNCRSVYNESIYGNHKAPTMFVIDYDYPIEYLRLFLTNNNFIGLYSNKGNFTNIYLTPKLASNFVGGWKDIANEYNFNNTFVHVDTDHLPSDQVSKVNTFWHSEAIYINFETTATFTEAKQTQLLWFSTYKNNKTDSTISLGVQTDETGNMTPIQLYANNTGLYASPSKIGKLTITGVIIITAPWKHTD